MIESIYNFLSAHTFIIGCAAAILLFISLFFLGLEMGKSALVSFGLFLCAMNFLFYHVWGVIISAIIFIFAAAIASTTMTDKQRAKMSYKRIRPLIKSSFYEKTLANRFSLFSSDIKKINEKMVDAEDIKKIWLTLDEKFAYYQGKTTLIDEMAVKDGVLTEIEKWRKEYDRIVEYSSSYKKTCFDPIHDLWAKYGVNINDVYNQLINGYETYEDIYQEMITDMNGTIAGIEGENRVNEALALFDDAICNLRNIRFVLGEKSAESDNIVITDNGIFTIEVKNFGEGSDYTIRVSKDGKWTREYSNGYSYDMKNVTAQAMMHVGVTQKLINSELRAKFGDAAPFVPVNPIIVIANDDIYIDNESDFPLMRISNIYFYMAQFKGQKLEKKYWAPIKEIIENNTLPPLKFPVEDRFSVLQTAYRQLADKTLAFYALLSTVFTYWDDAKETGLYIGVEKWKNAYKSLEEYNNAMQSL